MNRTGATSLIIGAGLMGHHHARLAAAAGARVLGVVDQNLDAAKRVAARFSGAVAWAGIDQALATGGATVAHVCTPPSTHLDIARPVAKAGLHALIEKPLAEQAEQARAIHDSFASAGKLVCPTHQYAFQRSIRATSARMPQLGALRSVAFDICSAGAVAGRMTADELIAEILPHPLSILQKLLPSIEVSALGWTCTRSAPGEWLVAAPWQGILLTMSLSAAGRPTRFLTRVTAERGSIQIDHFHDFAVTLPGTVSKAQKILAPFTRSSREFGAASLNLLARAGRREFAYPGLGTLVGEFYAAVRDQSAPPITPQESLAVAEARDRIIQQATRG